MNSATRILCVDDEKNVLRSLERIFLDDDYEILTAGSGEEGLELMEGVGEVQVVISDYRMPGMNGVDFLRQVYQRRPDSIRIVLSGYADTAAVVAAINEGKVYKFIPKPWNDDELRLTVAKAVETYQMRRNNAQLAEELRLKNEELQELNAHLEQLVEERTSEVLAQNRALIAARTILDNLTVGVVGIATDGGVVRVNREGARLLGVAAEEILGKPAAQVLPAELGDLLQIPPGGFPYGFCTRTVTGRGMQVNAVAISEGGEVGMVLALLEEAAGRCGND